MNNLQQEQLSFEIFVYFVHMQNDISCFHLFVQPPGKDDITVKKGSNPLIDSYSAFWDNADCVQTSLFVDLLKHGVTDVYLCGLAFDVCVKHSAIDALEQGFKTRVIVDGCRGVSPDGIAETRKEFLKNGIVLIESNKVCLT